MGDVFDGEFGDNFEVQAQRPPTFFNPFTRNAATAAAAVGGAAAAVPPPPPVPIDPNSTPNFLGESFHGSPRHLKKLAINGLHLVTEQGASTLFITATCNKDWDEFKQVIWPDSDCFDMPAIVCEVFKAKFDALIHNLKNGKYFGEDTTVFINDHQCH